VSDKVDEWLAGIWPRRCVLCDQLSGRLTVCAGCLGDLPWFGDEGPGFAEAVWPAIDRAWSACRYEYPLDSLVAAAKFGGRADIARALGEVMAEGLLRDGVVHACRPERLVPVALHRNRFVQRGYNQATELARPVARSLGIPVDEASCRRRRDTPAQTGLSGSARRKNIRGAFSVTAPYPAIDVAVVDDVLTTGSTAAALAAELRNAGATGVQVWTAAAVRNV